MNKVMRFTDLQEVAGQRVDKALVFLKPSFTRSYIQKLITDGKISIKSENGNKKVKAHYIVKASDILVVEVPPLKDLKLKPKAMNLSVVYEDKDLLVIDKPAGIVVHPGDKGSHNEDSLVNAILYYCGKDLSGIGGVARPGIVHRLDKDTSGLIIVAKNDLAHQKLVLLFKERKIEKIYYALCSGVISQEEGFIDAPITRHTLDRKKMAVSLSPLARNAQTKFWVMERFKDYTYCKVKLLTGRTHQIRVHFQSIGFPLVGDQIYGDKSVNKIFTQDFGLTRQFLHAQALTFTHPMTGKLLELEVSLPKDLKKVLKGLYEKKDL